MWVSKIVYSCCYDSGYRTSVAVTVNVPSLLGTYRYFKRVFSNFGVETTLVDMTDLAALEAAVQKNTKV